MTEDQLIDELEGMGVRVEWRSLKGCARGLFFARANLVVVRLGMTMPQRRSTLAHELIHARRQDEGPQPLSVERRVNEAAARLLITLAAYRAAEHYRGHHPCALATELDVTTTIIEAYQRALTTR